MTVLTVRADEVRIGDRIIGDPFGNPVRLRVATIYSRDIPPNYPLMPVSRTLVTFYGHDSAPNYTPGPRTLYYGSTDQLRIKREDA